MHVFILFQPPQIRKLTRLEENYCFEAGELRRIHLQSLEAAEEFLQEAQVSGTGAAFTL